MVTTTGKTQNIQETIFDRGWKIEIIIQGKGYTLALCHFNHATRLRFRFDIKDILPIYGEWIKNMKKMGYKITS